MLKLGHRGAPGYPRRFENTIISFEKALWSGADGFELDVRRCKKELVVFHDKTIERVTDGFLKTTIAELSYQELIEQIFQVKGYQTEFRVPLLSEVLSIFGNRCLINIEIKEKNLSNEIVWMIQRLGLSRSVMISCFDMNVESNSDAIAPSWNELRMFYPFSTALIASKAAIKKIGENDYISYAQELGAIAIHPYYRAITRKLMRLANNAGIVVNAWTVNRKWDIWRMRMLKVHGIISDFPELL